MNYLHKGFHYYYRLSSVLIKHCSMLLTLLVKSTRAHTLCSIEGGIFRAYVDARASPNSGTDWKHIFHVSVWWYLLSVVMGHSAEVEGTTFLHCNIAVKKDKARNCKGWGGRAFWMFLAQYRRMQSRASSWDGMSHGCYYITVFTWI